MKGQLTCLLFLVVFVSGCKQTEIDPPAHHLNGVYRGEVTYFALTTTGEIDTSYHVNSHSIEFEVINRTFNRAECGCRGAISVDTLSKVAAFTSSEKACNDNGSNEDSSWSFQNDIIGKFNYSTNGDTLKMEAPGTEKLSVNGLRKTILVVRQNDV